MRTLSQQIEHELKQIRRHARGKGRKRTKKRYSRTWEFRGPRITPRNPLR